MNTKDLLVNWLLTNNFKFDTNSGIWNYKRDVIKVPHSLVEHEPRQVIYSVTERFNKLNLFYHPWDDEDDEKTEPGYKIPIYRGDEIDFIDFDNLNTRDNNTNKHCAHEWSHYVGITESYFFCKKCDEKKQ